MLSKATKKRLSRIRKARLRGSSGSFSAGKISARRADTLLYLEPEEQRQELARILAEREVAVHRSRIAAEVIRGFVTAGRRDLVALQKHLRCALSRTARAASSSKTRQRAYIADNQRAFAGTIREYLDGLNGRRPDLEGLRLVLRRAC